jgi:hypothetical protein
MRSVVIFYAWQGDRPNNVNRGFIEKALEDAVAEFNARRSDIEIKIDKDTQGVSGTPPVTATILDKISHCDIFLPDLTFVARIDEGKKKGKAIPNPNVLIEYGYALRNQGHEFLLAVMNTAYGEPVELPFDMGHLRHPILYNAAPTDSEENRRRTREKLSRELLEALVTMIGSLNEKPAQQRISKEIKNWASEHHVSRVNSIYSLFPAPLMGGPKILLHAVPISAHEALQEIDFDTVRHQSANFIPYGFEQQDSRPDADSWLFFDPPPMLSVGRFYGRFAPDPGQSRWFIEINRNGVIEFACMVNTIGRPYDSGPVAIDGVMMEALIIHSIERLTKSLAMLEIKPPILICASLLEIQNCFLFRSRPSHAPGFTRQPVVLPQTVLESLSPPLASELRPLLSAIWRAAGWPDGAQSYSSGTWAGYSQT